MTENAILQYIVNYGLAGIVIYIFYRLISNELKELRVSIDKLNETILKLIERIAK
ncbi:MAG: hypothetical protein QXI68_02215 [Sulfolobales archaeon]